MVKTEDIKAEENKNEENTSDFCKLVPDDPACKPKEEEPQNIIPEKKEIRPTKIIKLH